MIQFDPPRDVDTYVHRSGRTGRAGRKGMSVLLFSRQQSRDIVRIERDLGHGFKFNLVGPPSIEAAMRAAAKTSASACMAIPDETVHYFKHAAAALLEEAENPEDVVARCLAAISRRSTDVQSRSLITGELGFASIEMSYKHDKKVAPGDVMFTIGKLSRMSSGELKFDSDVGKIQTQNEDGTAIFDLGVEDARRLMEFVKQEGVDTHGAEFRLVDELDVTRDRFFGQTPGRGDRGGGRGGNGYRGQGGGNRFNNNNTSQRGNGRLSRDGGDYRGRDGGGYRGRSDRGSGSFRGNSPGNSYRGSNRDETHRGWSNHEERRGGGTDFRRQRYDSSSRRTNDDTGGW